MAKHPKNRTNVFINDLFNKLMNTKLKQIYEINKIKRLFYFTKLYKLHQIQLHHMLND